MKQQTNAHKRVEPQESTDDLLAMLRFRYLSYWPLFVLAALIAAGGAWAYLRYATPVYKVSASLLVKDESKDLNESNLLNSLDLFGSKKNIENEIQILTSRTLIRDVIRKLDLYGELFVKGRLKNVAVYGESSPVNFHFIEPWAIKDGPSEFVSVGFDHQKKQVLLNSKPYPINDTTGTPWGRMVIRMRDVSQPVAEGQYFLKLTGERNLTQQILARMKIMPVSKMATVINLEYLDVLPARGEAIVNDLIRVYNEAAVTDKNRMAASTMSFVEERLRIVTRELSEVEKEVARFKTDEGIVDISEQSKMFLGSVQENDSKLNEANMQLSVLESIEKYVNGKTEGVNMVPATLGLSDPVLLELVNKLYETELEKERLKKTTGANSPSLTALNRQAEMLKPGILENIQSQRSNLEAGKAKLLSANDRFMGMLRSVPGKERALLEVSRQQAIKNNIYTFLLQKREETALAYAAAISDSRIVDGAETAGVPVSPRKMMVYAIAVLGGIAVVAIWITLKDMLKREITSRAEIEKETSAPIVAELLHDDSKDPLVITDGRRSLVAEQFRNLRTSLSYIGLNGGNKTLLVTSSISGEGKSFVSLNLASSLSLLRKKVVLMEFDLRKPMLSNMLGINREPGITNYLVGKAQIGDLVRPVPGNENLFLIPAGVIPPNPTELILNGRLEELIQELRGMFDYIIIDSAPVGLVTDARLLAPLSDACLYVLRHQVTPRQYLKQIDELYRTGEMGRLSLVYNGVKPRGVANHTYGYGYGYVEETKNGTGKKLKNMFK